ncbi:MAG: hypothetical protein HYZ28_13175 [Myxococcales bacterium]|nr:hypothetical protein [Myxococcales bacterium]
MTRHVCWLAFALASAALAQEPAPAQAAPSAPSAEEAKKVIEYYYKGKEQGPVLVELKACTKLDTGKDSPTKNECLEVVNGPVKKGTNVHGWTLWLVPDGGTYEDVAIQFVHEGQVRSTMDVKLASSLRSRTYRASPLSKAGKWEIKVTRGSGDAAKELAKVALAVLD